MRLAILLLPLLFGFTASLGNVIKHEGFLPLSSSNSKCAAKSQYNDCSDKKPDPSYYVCEDDKCVWCDSDSQCNDSDVCDKKTGRCSMKGLFPFISADFWTTMAISLGSILAAGGGLGGGGIFVPVFILIASMHTKMASALSQGTIFGGSIVNLVMNAQVPHPTRTHRPITDYWAILILEPALLGGTIIGVTLNVMFPNWLILITLEIVLLYATVRMWYKTYAIYQKECEAAANDDNSFVENVRNSADIRTAIAASAVDRYGSIEILSPQNEARQVNSEEDRMWTINTNNPEYERIPDNANQAEARNSGNNAYVEYNGNQYQEADLQDAPAEPKADGDANGNVQVARTDALLPGTEIYDLVLEEAALMGPIFWIGVVWVVVSAFNLIRGGKGGASVAGIMPCSSTYWWVTASVFPVLVAITWSAGKGVLTSFNRKIELQWVPAEGDIEWDYFRIFYYPTLATFAGLLGGMLGIGGGMILSPILLELGVLPRVASATSALAVMVTSSSATLQFILLGAIRLDYFAFYFVVGAVGTFIGQTAVNYIVHKYKRQSIIVLTVALVITAAIVLMGYQAIVLISSGQARNNFSAPC